MPDWEAIARGRLGRSTDDESVQEIAAHLEDAYEAAQAGGASHELALRSALAEAGDWKRLRRALLRARRGAEDMIRRIWIPGLFATLAANALQWLWGYLAATPFWMRIQEMYPGTRDSMPALIALPWVLSLPLAGAVGAYFSRRAAGAAAQRVIAALFPVLSIAGLGTIGFVVRLFGAGVGPVSAYQVLVALTAWFVLPAVFLALGASPFLKASESHDQPAVRA